MQARVDRVATRPGPGGEALPQPGDLARAEAGRREHLSPPLDSLSWSFLVAAVLDGGCGLVPHASPKPQGSDLHGSSSMRVALYSKELLESHSHGISWSLCSKGAGRVGQGRRRLIDPRAGAPTAGRNAGLLRDGAAGGTG
jgi:hypothetical protein